MKKYLVIGNPIKHSLSPKLHNYWIKENNIDAFALDAYSQKINFENDKLPYDDEYFDFVTLTSLIEHIVNPKILLQEINRVLKKKWICNSYNSKF